ncbi:MAG: SDR family oxidoreductase [Gemmatimonadetes bacterium]|nr:SDR family oxidoreductase [Gemmatimonadota bacterium]
MEIAGARVIVTGGSLGLGKETARQLIARQAKVVITGRDKARLQATAAELGAHGVVADVASDDDIERTFHETEAAVGGLDVLINNAGIGVHRPLAELTREDFRRVFEVNVFGAAMMAKRAAEIFRAQGHGNIVNVASTSGLRGYASGSVYSASKFAMRSMSECWRAEMRPDNIRVIQVNPSYVPTAFGRDDRVEKPPEPGKLTPSEIAHAIVGALEMDDRGFIPELSVFATNPF